MSIGSESLNKARRLLWPQFHRLLTAVSDTYAITQTTEDEYALTVLEPQQNLEERLPQLQFRRTPVSALKIRLDGNISDGSWVHRESLFADEQLHVVLHELEGRVGVDVYAHTEDNWIRHPLLHLRKKNYSAGTGVSLVRELFDADDANAASVEYEIKPRYRRDSQWFLYLIHLVSKPTARKLHELFSEPTTSGTAPKQ